MATIAQVAAIAGVSTATVSRYLNGTAPVGEERSHRIRRTVRDLEYTPSAKAIALATGERSRLATLAPSSLPDSVLGAVVSHASMLSKEVSFTSVLSRRHLDAELMRLMGDDRIAAVLTICMTPRLGQWKGRNRPPLIAAGAPAYDGSFVARDERAAGRLAARYLVDKGHRSLAFIAGGPSPSPYADPSVDRLLGYGECLRSIRSTVSCVRRHVVDKASALRAARRLIRRSRPPTAVVAATPEVALALVLAGIQHMGMEIITFDDSPGPDGLGLTAVGGEKPWPIALDMVSHAMSRPGWAPVHAYIGPVLVERHST